VKFGHVVFEICERTDTYRDTDRNTQHPSWVQSMKMHARFHVMQSYTSTSYQVAQSTVTQILHKITTNSYKLTG